MRHVNEHGEGIMMPAEGQSPQPLASCLSLIFTWHDLMSAWHATIVSWHCDKLQAYLRTHSDRLSGTVGFF